MSSGRTTLLTTTGRPRTIRRLKGIRLLHSTAQVRPLSAQNCIDRDRDHLHQYISACPWQLLRYQVFAHNQPYCICVLIASPICFQRVQQAPTRPRSLTRVAAQALLGTWAELAVGVVVAVVEGQEAKEVAVVVVVMKQQMLVAEGACNLSP